jgi:mRNA interferase MazF
MPSGLAVSGGILADQVKSLDWRARNAELICTMPAKAISEIFQKVGLLLSK